jgi:hypothetical protein
MAIGCGGICPGVPFGLRPKVCECSKVWESRDVKSTDVALPRAGGQRPVSPPSFHAGEPGAPAAIEPCFRGFSTGKSGRLPRKAAYQMD